MKRRAGISFSFYSTFLLMLFSHATQYLTIKSRLPKEQYHFIPFRCTQFAISQNHWNWNRGPPISADVHIEFSGRSMVFCSVYGKTKSHRILSDNLTKSTQDFCPILKCGIMARRQTSRTHRANLTIILQHGGIIASHIRSICSNWWWTQSWHFGSTTDYVPLLFGYFWIALYGICIWDHMGSYWIIRDHQGYLES